MPRLQTEYSRNFKWTDRPIRFKQPSASVDLTRGVCEPKRAGLTSSMTAIRREPAIQAKQHSASPVDIVPSVEPKQHHSHSLHRSSKQNLSLSVSVPFSDPIYRPVPPLITTARSEDAPPAGKPTWKRPGDPVSAVADDFILLGSQQKFAPNVAYRLRKPMDPSRFSQVPPRPPTAERMEHDTQTVELAPPPQIIIQSPPPPRFYTADENIQVAEVELPKDNLTPPPSPPDAPRRQKTPEPTVVQNEGVQTEVDDHYAVRQRLGLVSRINAGRFQTEYGRQFNPGHSVSAPAFRTIKQHVDSPVMNAEVMFRRSRSRSPTAAMPSATLETEYARSFRPYQWQLHQQPIRRSLSAEGHEIQYEGTVFPRAEKKQGNRKNEETVAKLKQLKWPKRFLSEYMSNFRQPSAFTYEDGTWKGVSQPHVLTQSMPTAVIAGDPSWIAEVRELKSRAKEYQLRNKATHFSSTHVGQLFSEKAGLWDTVAPAEQQPSDDAVRTAMLDIAIPQSAPPITIQQDTEPPTTHEYVQVNTLPAPEDLIPAAGLPTIRRGCVRESLEWAVQSVESSSGGGGSECASSIEEPVPVQLIAPSQPQPFVQQVVDNRPKTGRSEESSGTTSSSTEVLPTALGGRVRTSRIAELQAQGDGSPRRHHLDVTTPSVGGAILTSPPLPVTKQSKHNSRSGSRNRSSLNEEFALNTAGVSSGYSSGPISTTNRSRSPLAYGKPTADTHLIVERDQPIRFQYVPTPKDKLPATTAKNTRPLSATIEQVILERSRENAPVINAGVTKSKRPLSAKTTAAAPLSAKQPISRQDTKSTQRSVGMMASVPLQMSKTYMVNGPFSQKARPFAVAQKTVQPGDEPPSRASSATYSAASDILEKARARTNFWEKNVSAKA